ncbi:hypothetical protein FOA43_000020 [Brettanomyces nanus]|uniref:Uncharacterized protein n=1 Tax=Eeniella nana TaxID=13502 RepID=A0A875RYH0_EENNA|nr:uncharacterized protein FOA43_000020 [Brettanomyces nanus]QPG72719.1 hypothetical protein FOA43_000020 [Brettanomyces nanus]
MSNLINKLSEKLGGDHEESKTSQDYDQQQSQGGVKSQSGNSRPQGWDQDDMGAENLGTEDSQDTRYQGTRSQGTRSQGTRSQGTRSQGVRQNQGIGQDQGTRQDQGLRSGEHGGQGLRGKAGFESTGEQSMPQQETTRHRDEYETTYGHERDI